MLTILFSETRLILILKADNSLENAKLNLTVFTKDQQKISSVQGWFSIINLVTVEQSRKTNECVERDGNI